MNTDLLLRVRDQILATPHQFDMEFWHLTRDCETTHCIAGWVIKFAKPENDRNGVSVAYAAADLLGLDGRAATNLFYSEDWPEDFRVPYETAYARRDYVAGARIAAARIDHFIATETEREMSKIVTIED